MKEYYDIEVSYKDTVIGSMDGHTNSEFMFGEDTTEKIVTNRIFPIVCDDIFNKVNREFTKFDTIMITFIDDDGIFICSVGLTTNRFKKKLKNKYSVAVYDWKGNNIQLKFKEPEEKEIK